MVGLVDKLYAAALVRRQPGLGAVAALQAKAQRALGEVAAEQLATAMLAAGQARMRPVLMTATAMILGMLPMALGMGEGGEQNAPLGRAVIGGLVFATVATLLFVPVVFSVFHGWIRKRSVHKSR